MARLAQPASLDDVLLYRMSRLLGTAGTRVIRLCEGTFGITRREWRIIALLARGEDLLSSQLAERVQLDRARTSRAITSLVGKNLLQRRTGEADRRQALLALTDAGRDLYARLYPQVVEINRELLSTLGVQDVECLDRALDALQRRADALVAHADMPKADRHRGGRSRPTTR